MVQKTAPNPNKATVMDLNPYIKRPSDFKNWPLYYFNQFTTYTNSYGRFLHFRTRERLVTSIAL